MSTETRSTAKRCAWGGVLSALALLLGYVEAHIPLGIGIPGVKLGLGNIVVLLALDTLGAGYAACIALVKIAVSSLLFGTGMSFLFSLGGGVLSFLVMWGLLKTKRLSCTGVSIAGGTMHNLGQLAVASLWMREAGVWIFLGPLLACGAACGLLSGILTQLVEDRLRHIGKGHGK